MVGGPEILDEEEHAIIDKAVAGSRNCSPELWRKVLRFEHNKTLAFSRSLEKAEKEVVKWKAQYADLRGRLKNILAEY